MFNLNVNVNLDAAKERAFKEEKIADLNAKDPVSLKVDWGPLAMGGSSHKTRELTQVSAQRYELKLTSHGYALPVVFMFAGGVPLALGLLLMSGGSISETGLTLVAFGVLFSGVGYVLWRDITRPVVFDFEQGRHWRGADEEAHGPDSVALSELHAIQLISEWVVQGGRGRRRSQRRSTNFTSYELNLVRADGSRVNVMDHGDLRSVRATAERLSALLEIPIWDLILH